MGFRVYHSYCECFGCAKALSSVTQSLQPHGPQHARLPCPSPTLQLAQTHIHRIGDAIQPSHPLSSPCLQSFPAPVSFPMSQFFTSGGQSIGSVSSSISPSSEYSGRISFRMDWMDLLEVQGTLKSLLQHHSSKASTFVDNHCWQNVFAFLICCLGWL